MQKFRNLRQLSRQRHRVMEVCKMLGAGEQPMQPEHGAFGTDQLIRNQSESQLENRGPWEKPFSFQVIENVLRFLKNKKVNSCLHQEVSPGRGEDDPEGVKQITGVLHRACYKIMDLQHDRRNEKKEEKLQKQK